MTSASEEQPVYGPHVEDSRYVAESMAFSADISITASGEVFTVKGFVADEDSGLFVPSEDNVYQLEVNHAAATHFDMFNNAADMEQALDGTPYMTVFDVSKLGSAAHAAGTRANMTHFLKSQLGSRGASSDFKETIVKQAEGMMQMRLFAECGEGDPVNLQEIFGDVGMIAIGGNQASDDNDQAQVEPDFGPGVYL